MKLTKDWEDFKIELSHLIEEGNSLSKNKNSNNTYDNHRLIVEDWKNKVENLFSESFDEKSNEFTNEIKNSLKENNNTYQINTFNFNQNLSFQRNIETNEHTKISNLYKKVDSLINN